MYLASGSVLGVIAIVIGLIVWKSANPTRQQPRRAPGPPPPR
jgi:hypothetical protein